MINFRNQQLEVLQRSSRDDFESRAVVHVKNDLPPVLTKNLEDSAILFQVRRSCKRATDYGLCTEKQLMCFVDATFLLGLSFETEKEHPWALELLHSERLSDDDKARLLLATACSLYQDSQI